MQKPDEIADAAGVIFASMLAPGDNREVLSLMVATSVLRAYGCTCHDPRGEACFHTEDLFCPVHRYTVTS